MEEFTYIDIFDTKGIEYIIIIVFLLLLIPFWRLLNKPLKVKAAELSPVNTLSEKALHMPGGFLFGKNYTWAHMEKSGMARIGIGDLLLRITGDVLVDKIRTPGDKVAKGEIIATLSQNGKKLDLVSPVSGEIGKINKELFENPEYLNSDPYGKGWMLMVKPENWIGETGSFLFGDKVKEWTRNEIIHLKDFLARLQEKYSPGMSQVVFQEGGELRINPLSEMDEFFWEEFGKEFIQNES